MVRPEIDDRLRRVIAKNGHKNMRRRVNQCDIVNYLDTWSTCYLEKCVWWSIRGNRVAVITSYGRDPARVAAYSSLVSDKRTRSLVNDNEAS